MLSLPFSLSLSLTREHLSALSFAQGCEVVTSSDFHIGASSLVTARSAYNTRIRTRVRVCLHADRYTPRSDADYSSESQLCYFSFVFFNGSASFPEKGLGIRAK